LIVIRVALKPYPHADVQVQLVDRCDGRVDEVAG
jgi:hypothetical protein